jgi:hypothetical protein
MRGCSWRGGLLAIRRDLEPLDAFGFALQELRVTLTEDGEIATHANQRTTCDEFSAMSPE